jgi:predicted transcriptional regulator
MEVKVLMSIKPEFADKIFDQTKKFEFRRAIFKNPDVKKVIVYSSFPVQKVIGEFEIDTILELGINALWEETSKNSGISLERYKRYFDGKKQGYAIKIKKTKKYRRHKCLKDDFNIQQAPQSFRYVA